MSTAGDRKQLGDDAPQRSWWVRELSAGSILATSDVAISDDVAPS